MAALSRFISRLGEKVLPFFKLLKAYAHVVKPRETITSVLEWIRIAQLQPNADTIDINLSAWVLALFIT